MQPYVTSIQTDTSGVVQIKVFPRLKKLIPNMKDYIVNVTFTQSIKFNIYQDTSEIIDNIDNYNETMYG